MFFKSEKNVEKEWINVSDAVALCGYKRGYVYELINKGIIPSAHEIVIDRTVYKIPTKKFLDFMAKLEEIQRIKIEQENKRLKHIVEGRDRLRRFYYGG